MGVTCHFIQVAESKLWEMDDESIARLFDETSRRGTGTQEELRRYEVADEPRLPMSDLRPDEPRRPIPAFTLEKRWSELLLFLNGREMLWSEDRAALPLVSQAIAGGEPIGPVIDEMYTARVHWSREVETIAEALATLSREELRRRFFDPEGFPPSVLKQMVRPCTMAINYNTPDDLVYQLALPRLEPVFDGLLDDLDCLTAYYRIAAQRGNAMLIGFI